ncbi:PAS domain S-box protein [Methanoregula sp.]|uniref:PAS domain S-box protein n=1 Tax=Methanoregula sp. TaxID=2052170 RepID=UPI003C72EEB3
MIIPEISTNDDVPQAAAEPCAVAEADLFKKITCVFGLLVILTSLTGIIGNISGIILISSVCQGCKTMALSAAVIWIFFGAILVYSSIKTMGRTPSLILRATLVVVAGTECMVILANLMGGHFFVESWSVAAGSVLFGPLSSPISPVAAVLIILAAIGLFFSVDPAFFSPQCLRARESTVVAGIIITLAGFTLVLSYFYGNPLIFAIPVIPIAALSAISAFFVGAGLIAAAGPATPPVCHFRGTSIKAMLLRNFVTLTVTITLCENILFYIISSWYIIPNALVVSVSMVTFIIATASIVGQLSGEIGQTLDKAEQALVHKNEELGEINEELMAVEEELRQNIDALTETERNQQESDRFLRETEKIAKLGGWKANPHLDYFLWTEGIYDIIEAPRDYRPGLTESLNYFSPEDRPLIRNRIETCLSTGEPFTLEVLATTGTGKKVWTELRGLNLVTDGARSFVIGTFQNITERRQIEDKLKKESGKLDILAESARLLLSSEMPEYIVQLVGERVMRYLRCQTFFNYIIDGSGERMRLNAYAGITDEEASRIEHMNLGEAICGRVARDGERMVVHDILTTDDEKTRLVRSFGISGYACYPLIYHGRTLGTLSFGTCDQSHFTDDELDLMRAVTDLVATAMARKNVEDTLRGTSQYLESLIDYANAPIIVWDKDLRIQRFNHAFEFLTGMAAGSVLGKPLDILFPEKSRHESMELIQKTGTGERWESVEIPIRHVSGATKIVLWNSANIHDADGITISSTIAQGQDITERKIAEETTTKTASLLNAALDSTADGILVVDTDGNITGYNKTFCAIWSIPERTLDSAREKTALTYMTPLIGDPREFVARLKELYAHPGRESYDTVSITDGRVFERYSKPQKIGEIIVGRVWSYRDITERRQAEEALRVSLEKFRIIATNTPDHILVQDSDLRYTQVINPQMGLTEQDMIGKTDYDILPREEADNLTEIKRHVLESGTAVNNEIPLVNARGEMNFFDGSYVPKRNAAGEIDGLIGYFKNVTDTKYANEKIVAALAEKEILIREIHHRVKNNLQIISGLLDMTRMRSGDPATAGILTDMMMKIKTMAQIHTRLYESKQFDKVNIGGQIREQAADLSSIYGRSGPEITCQVDAKDLYLPVDQAIPCALVVNEALSNAFKHAFRGRGKGNVAVSAWQDGGIFRISIRDDGTGIPKDVDISRATSLGLKLIRSLVQQLRGTLLIESTDLGSVVNVEFPIQMER